MTFLNFTLDIENEIGAVIRSNNRELRQSTVIQSVGAVDVSAVLASYTGGDVGGLEAASKEDLLESVQQDIHPEQQGTPLFLLFNLLGEQGAVIPVAFDSCSSYTIFDEIVPGKLLHAAQVRLPDREWVRGIGGTRPVSDLGHF